MILSIDPQVSNLKDPLTIKLSLKQPQDLTVEYIVDTVGLQHKIVICEQSLSSEEVTLVTSPIEDASLMEHQFLNVSEIRVAGQRFVVFVNRKEDQIIKTVLM